MGKGRLLRRVHSKNSITVFPLIILTAGKNVDPLAIFYILQIHLFWETISLRIKKNNRLHYWFLPKVFSLNIRDLASTPNLTKDLVSHLITSSQNYSSTGMEILPVVLAISSIQSWYKKIWHYLIIEKIADQLSAFDNPNYFSYCLEKWSPFFIYVEHQPYLKC